MDTEDKLENGNNPLQLRPWGFRPKVCNRPDGRASFYELRSVECNLSLLSNADGSARFRMGSTSVTAATFGPKAIMMGPGSWKSSSGTFRDPRMGARLDVVVRPLSGSAGPVEKYLEGLLQLLLERAIDESILSSMVSVSVVVQPEADDGGLLSCMINAASCSLVDAGIPLKYTVLAISCADVLHTTATLPYSPPSTSATCDTRTHPSLVRTIVDPTYSEFRSIGSQNPLGTMLDPSSYTSLCFELTEGQLLHAVAEVSIQPKAVPNLVGTAVDSNCKPTSSVVREPLQNSIVDSLPSSHQAISEYLTIAYTACSILKEILRKNAEHRFMSVR